MGPKEREHEETDETDETDELEETPFENSGQALEADIDRLFGPPRGDEEE